MKNDSVWATVLAVAKEFGQTPEWALWGISYANAVMYGRAAPGLYDEPDEGAGWNPALDANNPENFKNLDNEYVR